MRIAMFSFGFQVNKEGKENESEIHLNVMNLKMFCLIKRYCMLKDSTTSSWLIYYTLFILTKFIQDFKKT